MAEQDATSADDPIESAAAVLQALALPLRLRIVLEILDREATATELADRLGIAYATLAQHLRHLRVAGLLHRRRDGNHVRYTASPPATVLVHAILTEIPKATIGPIPVTRARPRQ
jgi:DNA-binding transcriptional ArsR family regulator